MDIKLNTLYEYYKTNHGTLHCGDCQEVLKTIPDNSIDSIVTDPPYELNFMNKKWDNSGIAYNINMWKECLRVLKPGGHLLSFGSTRTYHRMTCAIEDAGFEIKNMIEWIYASGFPKSLNIGKNYDKKMGNKREDLGIVKGMGKQNPEWNGTAQGRKENYFKPTYKNTKGYSPYEGQGTALKPAHEPICLARKPLSEKTIIDNIIKYQTGGLNIDDCRIPVINEKNPKGSAKRVYKNNSYTEEKIYGDNTETNPQGRFPANIICQDDALNDGEITKGVSGGGPKQYGGGGGWDNSINRQPIKEFFNDSGSKSRYFDLDVWAEKHGLLQFPKAPKSEKNKGLDNLPDTIKAMSNGAQFHIDGYDKAQSIGLNRINITKNNHPTIKPLKLISYLVSLITPMQNMTVLDPFSGSGTTAIASILLNKNFILIEKDPQYCEIAKHRIIHYSNNINQSTDNKPNNNSNINKPIHNNIIQKTLFLSPL